MPSGGILRIRNLNWNFDNSFAEQLEGFYAPVKTEAPPAPELLLFNPDLAQQLALPVAETEESELAAILGGGQIPEGAQPIAFAYSGHQFGQYSPQLGDGRAALLGEVVSPDGDRFDLQFKGSGRTPFSRGGDGKLLLGPALREYLMSEAMAAISIKTTRALSVVTTGESVPRQPPKPGAVLMRVASSHIRVGTFQFFAANVGPDHVRKLADYAISRHYPDAAGKANPYLAFLEAVMDAQIRLIADWMMVGFVHGVMNTDNVTVSGETIDYGPCAFIDAYARDAVFSSIDTMGRYAFGNQPNIGRWNIVQLATALAEVISQIDEDGLERINALLADYPQRYLDAWIKGMRRKLGLKTELAADFDLANTLFATLEGQNVDYTLFFRNLAKVPEEGAEAVSKLFKDGDVIGPWIEQWLARLEEDELSAAERRAAMDNVNPLYIPRNHMVEEALAAAEGGDMVPFMRLLEIVRNPYCEREDAAEYALPAPSEFSEYVTFCGT